ncbi:MAG TPA: pitrilysin family protein [Clostridiales bacterium]|nr:pitrilysin family protein [Clostridiales bacterium]
MEEIKNIQLNESYFKVDHPSGLTILVMPKEGYASSYAVFATKYGSIDNKIPQADGSFKEIPEGTAHFLEHKLFESEELDAFARFAQTGASANAYTGFDRTGYLFTCTDNFKESLEILLDFVQKPYFTQETVEKEQGIIGQEIRMYKDLADWAVLFNLLKVMYHKNPVRHDIAGTQQSIAQITADLLYDCYKTFYNLNNMVLAVAGNVSLDEVLSVADKMLKGSSGSEVQREFIIEPEGVIEDYIEQKLEVSAPQFLLGFKQNVKSPLRSAEERVGAAILLDVLAGRASTLYKELLEAELINSSFSYEYFEGFGYACPIFGGESKDPHAAAELIKEKIKSLRKEKVKEADFNRSKRKLYGRMVMMYNDVDELANELAGSFFNGNGLFDDLEVCKAISLDSVNGLLDEIFNEDASVLSLILPA